MDPLWHIEMLGWLRATHGDQVVSCFRTRKTAALLAYLALYAHRSPPRDLLVELLWPESEPDATRTSLRVALASLRRQLEPPGVPGGSVLLADRATVQLNPAAIVTDVAQFEAALDAAARAGSEAEQVERLTQAVSLYRGELLPAFYDAWVLTERERLAEAHLQALGQLARCLEQAGELPRALEVSRRAVAADPLREEAHQDLIRLLKATGQHEAARCQAQEQLLADDLAASPSAVAIPAPLVARPRSPEARLQEAPSSPSAAPPERTKSLWEGYLPLPLTRFFGREREFESLQELLLTADTRLVTLTGPGGSGKTRLALEVAARLREPFAGAVWFVPLVDLADPQRIADQMRDALRLPRTPEAEPLEQLVAFLSRQPSLLLLDNFEHLVDEGAPVVQSLLERVAPLTVMVTSRRRLDLSGERDFPVLPLPTPEVMASAAARRPEERQEERDGPERLLECASVRLFVDRAQAVRPDFQLRPGNAAAVAALCVRLEGLPLALELAAARSGVLTPPQMLARLEKRFDLLSRSGRAVAERHRSLRAALDWSYQLLSPELQRFFAWLSVFRGGWTLAAAEAISAQPNALDYLAQLRDCSLVVAEEGTEEMRFRFLETIQEYGQARLAESRDLGNLLQQHAAYYLMLAEQASSRFGGPDHETWRDRLEIEHDNLGIALEWSVRNGEAEVGLRIAAALCGFWSRRGYWSEVQLWAAKVLSMPEAAPRIPLRARLLLRAGYLAHSLSDYTTARSLLEESLQISREVGDRDGVAEALIPLGHLDREEARLASALARYQESLAISQEMGDDRRIAGLQTPLGLMAVEASNFEEARARFEEGLARYRDLGDRSNIAVCLANLGAVAADQADWAAARAYTAEAVQHFRQLGDKVNTMRQLDGLARAVTQQGEYDTARRLLGEVLAMANELGREASATALMTLGEIALCEGDRVAACAHYEEAVALLRKIGHKRGIGVALTHLGAIAFRQGNYGAAQVHHAEALAVRAELWDQERIAESLEALAQVAGAKRQLERAARLFGAAARCRGLAGAHLTPPTCNEQTCDVATVRTALGEETFTRAWAEGQAMPLEQAIEYALAAP